MNVKIKRQIQNYQEEVCDLFQGFYRKYMNNIAERKVFFWKNITTWNL